MNNTRLEELREKYKNRNLLEELAWGTYANHSGYTTKQNGEFLNWLCNMAYRTIKATEPKTGNWIVDIKDMDYCFCSECKHRFDVDHLKFSWDKYEFPPHCPNCGADMREVKDETD